MHLAVDGYTGATEKLQDPEFVRRFLDGYPDAIGMTKIVPPTVTTYHGPVPEDWGRFRVRHHRREPHQRPHFSLAAIPLGGHLLLQRV